MYVVRNTFIAKPGHGSKLADLMSRVFADKDNYRVMTDFVSDFNTVVMESTHESLADYERSMKDYAEGKVSMDPALVEEMKNYASLWQSGKREVFKVVKG